MIKIMNYIDLLDTLKTYSFDELYENITIVVAADGGHKSYYTSELYDITTEQDDEGKLIIKIYRI